MKLTQWKQGQVVMFNGLSHTIIDVRVGKYQRGYRSVIATTDGLPAHLTARCTCIVVTNEYGAVDLVTEAAHLVCGACRTVVAR